MRTSETAGETSGIMGIKRSHVLAACSIAVGLCCAFAVGLWPKHAVPIQMALYTYFVIVPLFLGFWSERRRGIFWVSMSSAILAHGLFLYGFRSVFPFKTVLVVIPTALIEALALIVAMDKILGERST